MNRKIDSLGRIVLPKEMRDKIGLDNESEAKIELVNDKIIVTNPKKVDTLHELEKWLKCMMEVSNLDLNCLQSVLNKIDELKDTQK